MPVYHWKFRDYPRTIVSPCRISLYVGVLLAFPGLSQDYHTPPAPTGLSQHPLVRVSLYARVSLAVPGLSQDYGTPLATPCYSIHVCWATVPLQHPFVRVALLLDYRTPPAPPCQSSPSVGLPNPSSTPWSEYLRMTEYD